MWEKLLGGGSGGGRLGLEERKSLHNLQGGFEAGGVGEGDEGGGVVRVVEEDFGEKDA
ncbi:F-box/kelch-repeat protein OR23-like [Pyrus ussuriensis x Pyrus communis]|uniref:F-box/kelch-repeat protein OR23-like n=1 Tax=Pyrus ussuriensis x Pyrus communis TaxID=2448454 RepID=A0A5N5G2N7_9ROSA|nr:F-box/kelch-repeat protein OR23-like [Pyrus ussuriensis x Pyrus communis]